MTTVPFNESAAVWGNATHFDYLQRYLDNLGAQTVFIEEPYVDRGYLIDYCNFHARSLAAPDRYTTRLHFFAKQLSQDDILGVIEEGTNEAIECLQEAYLGFVVLKPVSDYKGRRLVGRTVLTTYPEQAGNDLRRFITGKRPVSLYGVPLEVKSLPYLTQDIAVGACATTALWVADYALNPLFGTQLLSPSQITKLATEIPGLRRVFPSQGLSLMQILGFIHALGLEMETVEIEAGVKVADVVKAYLRCGLPVIAVLDLCRSDRCDDHHAVVITGYRAAKDGSVKMLYVHDDGIGPYSRVLPVGDLSRWENEWISRSDYDEVRVDMLVIPVYHKIRLTFGRVYTYFREFRDRAKEMVPGSDLEVDLFLTLLTPYREELLKSDLADNKVDVLTDFLARFLWVIRMSYAGEPLADVVLDATNVYPRRLRTIRYA